MSRHLMLPLEHGRLLIEHAKILDVMNGYVLWRHGTESWMSWKDVKEEMWFRSLDSMMGTSFGYHRKDLKEHAPAEVAEFAKLET